MKSNYRYKLDKSSRKFPCFGCGQKRMNRYIDTETGEYLPEQFGLCDRLNNCAYHLDPYKSGYVKEINPKERTFTSFKAGVTRSATTVLSVRACIPISVLKETQKDYEKNTFIQNLHKNIPFPFGAEVLERVVNQYHIGTNSDWRTGAVCFPFIDDKNNIRAIQVKDFDEANHTKKNGTNSLPSILEYKYNSLKQARPDWIVKYKSNETKFSCFFGTHLLKRYPNNPVYLVEAAKTCVIGTLYYGFPDDSESNPLWLGVYNLTSLTKERCEVLKGRKVTLIPDLKAFDKWKERAAQLSRELPSIRFHISDKLEKIATPEQRERGEDIADFLILKPHGKETKQPADKPQREIIMPPSSRARACMCCKTPEQEFSDMEKRVKSFYEPWDLADVEAFYSTATIPLGPIRLSSSTVVNNPPVMFKNHLETVRRHNGNPTYKGYLYRLELLKWIIKQG